jgi:restriction endonuclease Mrr
MSTSRPRGQTITVSQAAALLGRSDRWVQGLVKAGYIERANRGEYTLVAVIRGALAYYEDQITKNNKAAAATRASEARTREIELRIRERSRELIAMEDARAVVGEMAALVRAELAGLAARYTRDMEARRVLEEVIDDALERIAGGAEKAGAALETGSSDLEAEREA